MALKIKLARGGGKNNPHYSIVVMEARNRRDGQFVEKLGHYHPTAGHSNPDRIVVDAERINHWVSVGALPTEAVVKVVSRKDVSLLRKFAVQPKENKFKGMSKKDVAEQKKAEAKAIEEARKAKAAAKAKATEEAKIAAEARVEQETTASTEE